MIPAVPYDSDDDPAALRARLSAETAARARAEALAVTLQTGLDVSRAEVAALQSSLVAVAAQRDALQRRVDALLRGLYRPKAEKLDPAELERAFVAEFGADDPATEAVAAAQAAEAPDDEETPRTQRERRKHPGRRKLPAQLERVVVDERPPAEECCGQPMRDAGVEISEQLDFVKAHYRVRRNVKHKLACAVRDHRVVRPGPPPDHPLERCGATVPLLAKVIVEKYDRHVPLNRQAEEAARQDVPLSKATQCAWLAELAFVLAPLGRELRRNIAAGDRVNFDDTGITVLDPTAPGGSKKAHLWAYLGGGGDAVFDYTTARTAAGPQGLLAEFRGYAQCDAAGQHDGLFGAGSGRREVGCMAHARRYFIKAAPTDGPVAAVALAFFRKLYAVEHEAQAATPEPRRALRRRKAVPLLKKFFAWARTKAQDALPKSPLGKAFGYLLRNQVALARYVKDGRLTIDNNAAERALRTVAVGRNNWQFAGSDEGGRRAALFYSLMYSCRLAHVDPYAYLEDVLTKLGSTAQQNVFDLTPRGWKAARARDAPTVPAPSIGT